ncbi:MarR family winged helix-turn-helix transcriptional regulator [Gordonia polyisoprenivorans]|uniref:MarR family winged helix-turn-helix transcriptional regulator n=1 Tax=Gordonia polyisoprenivorans TaxID=84595 RepID=UPI0023014045|nr:MarR family transcriptional regulator [Gordonia polyisoprenivorans]WCB36673.1 MarR family transcriptional regulator [Gordonia polyisoprenivorans]
MSTSIDSACRALHEFLDRLTCLSKAAAVDDLATTDLTFSQIRVLFVAGDAQVPMSVHEIAEAIGLSLAATGRTVDRLVRLGFVDRREDPADRRVKRVSLTAGGRHLVDEQLSVRQEIISDFVAGLPAEHRDALTDALRPIVDADTDYFDLTHPTLDPHRTHDQKVHS